MRWNAIKFNNKYIKVFEKLNLINLPGVLPRRMHVNEVSPNIN